MSNKDMWVEASIDQQTLSELFQHIRVDYAGMQVDQFAEAVGTSPGTIRSIEKGQGMPSMNLLSKVGATLGLDITLRIEKGGSNE